MVISHNTQTFFMVYFMFFPLFLYHELPFIYLILGTARILRVRHEKQILFHVRDSYLFNMSSHS